MATKTEGTCWSLCYNNENIQELVGFEGHFKEVMDVMWMARMWALVKSMVGRVHGG